MAQILTDTELDEVRLLLDLRLTENQFTNESLRSNAFEESAVDYVFSKVIQNIDISRLNETKKALILPYVNGTSDNIETFLSEILLPRQIKMFRRAVINRTAGLAVYTNDTVSSQSIQGEIQEEILTASVSQKRESLFTETEEQIMLISNAFKSDAFLNKAEQRERVPVTLMKTTRC